MRLSTLALDILKIRPQLRQNIADKLGVTDQTVKRWRRDNEPHGDLTKEVAIQLIIEDTGFTRGQVIIMEMELQESDVHNIKHQ